MNVHRNAVTKSSLSKGLNPYKACIYGFCRDFLDGIGYDLGTKINFAFGSKLKYLLGSIQLTLSF